MSSELTQQRLIELVSYNPETGEFINKISRGNLIAGCNIGGIDNSNGYARICIDGKRYKAHRLAWLYVYGNFPKNFIDHVDGNKSNNKISNLRECSHAQNHQNRLKNSTNNCGFLGVHFSISTGKYRAQIQLDGENRHIGLFDSPEEAHNAYLSEKKNLHKFNPIPRG